MDALKELDQLTIQEMSMVDLVYHLLQEAKEPLPFEQLFQQVTELKGLTVENRLDLMARLFTEINIDGRFKLVGEDSWGLRSWYPVEQSEEVVITTSRKKKKRAVEDDYDDELMDHLDDEEELDDDLIDEELDDLEDDEFLDDDLADLDDLDDLDDDDKL